MPMGRGISASEASPSPYRPKSRFFEPLKDILSSERGMAEKWSGGEGRRGNCGECTFPLCI